MWQGTKMVMLFGNFQVDSVDSFFFLWGGYRLELTGIFAILDFCRVVFCVTFTTSCFLLLYTSRIFFPRWKGAGDSGGILTEPMVYTDSE